MKSILNKIPVELLVTAIICIFFFSEFRYKVREFDNWTGIFNADVNGYYLYLPALFVHGELDLSFTESEELITNYEAYSHFDIYTGEYHENGRKYTKYYVGTAVMQVPFFISALLYTQFSPSLSDGYSMPFQVAVFIAALFYFLAGLYFIKCLLKRLDFKRWTIQLTILAIALGTNAFDYVWFEPGMSHAYVFCCIAGFINYVHSFFQQANKQDLFKAAFFLGLICIIRPTSALIIISLPLLAGSFSKLKDGFQFLLQNIPALFQSIVILFGLIFCQLLMYKLQVGQWWIWSYGDEGFNFSNPKFFEILIGFRKGLFIYSPLTILFVIGSFLFIRRNNLRAGNLILAFVLFNYILSSWWNWWYGGSFGMRAFIDFYPLFSIPLALLIQVLHRSYYALILPLIILLGISLNLFQNLQYSRSIIDFDFMTKEKYLQVFLEIGDEFRFITADNRKYLNEETDQLLASYGCDFEGPTTWPFPDSVGAIEFDSGNSEIAHFIRMDTNRAYGPAVEFSIDSIPFFKSLVFKYEADLFIYNKRSDASIVFSVKGNNSYWFNQRIITEVRTTNEWKHASFEFKANDIVEEGDVVAFYLLSPTGLPVGIDNIRFSVYALD